MDFFSSSRGKKDGKRSGLFGKKSATKSNPASPPHPSYGRSPNKRAETEYDFPISDEQRTYRKQPASERIPNSHPRPPVYGYGTPEHRRDHGRERVEAMSYEAERTPERRRKPSEYSREHEDRMFEADTRSNASPFHPFRSPSPSPYHTPDGRRDHYEEAMYEPESNTMFQNSPPATPFHPPTTPDGRINEQFEDLYEPDGDVTPRNSSPLSPFHPAPQSYRTSEQLEAHGGAPPYYSSSDDDNHSTYLYPEIATPTRSSTPLHHNNYQMVVAETCEPPELPDESQSFTLQEIAKMRGLKEKEESQSMISVANYRVRLSVAETLQAILDKHGDIASSSKLQSIKTRSYYLESLAAVVMELRSTVLRDLTKKRVGEMVAVVKDMESVKIEVSWLKKVVAEVEEAVEYIGEYDAAKMEREVCEREMKAGKEEMEEKREELRKREKEIRECRERVTVVAGKIGELEMKGLRLKQNLELFHSKLHNFQGEAVLVQL